MYKILISTLLLGSVLTYDSYQYTGSITPAVVLAGGIIKAQNTEIVKKYKRKDCPVCEGKGWYMSGDGIKKVNCGYCEPDTKDESKIIMHPPAIIKQNCPNGSCQPSPNIKR